MWRTDWLWHFAASKAIKIMFPVPNHWRQWSWCFIMTMQWLMRKMNGRTVQFMRIVVMSAGMRRSRIPGFPNFVRDFLTRDKRGYLHTFELTNSWVLLTTRCCPSQHLGKSRRHHKSHWNVTNIGLEQRAGPVSTGWLLHCSGAGFTTSSSRTETRRPATSCGEHTGQLWGPGARVRTQGWSWWWPDCCRCCWCCVSPPWQPPG